jgi:hypothetical protein
MKKTLTVLLSLSFIFLSCKKQTENTLFGGKHQTEKAVSPVEENTNAGPSIKLDGEDEDRRKKMQCMDYDNNPVRFASITVVNGTDTLRNDTDSSGEAPFSVNSAGLYDIKVTHDDFQTLDTVISLGTGPTRTTLFLKRK